MTILASDILADCVLYGFDDISDSEFLVILNYCYNDFNNIEAWPYLEKLVTGNSTSATAQLFSTTLDIKQVLSLINMTQGYTLTPYNTDQFYKDYASALTTTGQPQIYYLTSVDTADPNGWNLSAWPVANNSSDVYQLRYLYLPPDLGLSDEPVLPSRYHRILTFACLVELYEQEDDIDAAIRMQNKYDRALARMRDDLWSKQYDRQDYIGNLDYDTGGNLSWWGSY